MPSTSQKNSVFQALSYAWQFGYTMVVPLVVFAVAGRLLDRKFGTSPWLLLTGVVLSMILSSMALTRKALIIMRDAERAAKEEQTRPNDTPHKQ